MDMGQWDKPMNFIEFMAVKGQLKRDLRLMPEEWLRLLAGHLDSSGDFHNLLDTSGYISEVNSGTWLTRGTSFYYFEKTFTADGGGTLAATELLASPGAGNVYVIGTIAMPKASAASANGAVTVTCDTETIATFSTIQTTDHKPVPLNIKLAATAAVNVAGGNLGAATKVDVAVTYAVVAA